MPANQFFTDWVTGDIITAAKLNTMKNSVQPYFGNYTPLNKAGDTWTGDLIGGDLYASRYLGITGDINEAKWFLYTGDYSTYLFSDHSNTSALPGVSNQTIFGRTYRAKAAFRPEGHLDIAGEYRGRYDHQNRFMVSAFAGEDIPIPANSAIFIVNLFISISSGKSLYIRRVRSYVDALLRFRISALSAWTASDSAFENDVNTLIVSGPFAGAISFGFTNSAASTVTLIRGFGAWAEMEIR